MKSQAKLFLTCAACAFVVSAGPLISTALAADAAAPAMAVADPIPFWWFHGTVEAGGRFFLNNPQRDGVASQGGKSLAKPLQLLIYQPAELLLSGK